MLRKPRPRFGVQGVQPSTKSESKWEVGARVRVITTQSSFTGVLGTIIKPLRNPGDKEWVINLDSGWCHMAYLQSELELI